MSIRHELANIDSSLVLTGGVFDKK